MTAKRQHLIETAIRLFSEYGFHGTGIDLIADQANVSKKTMYKYFRSKEELILAALKHHDGVFRNDFMRGVDQLGGSAYDRLLNIFDVAYNWFSDNRFYGCMYINAIGEYSDKQTPIREVCKEFKRLMRSYIEQLAIDAKLENPMEIADTLSILLEGSIVTAQVSGKPDAAISARQGAKILIDNALK